MPAQAPTGNTSTNPTNRDEQAQQTVQEGAAAAEAAQRALTDNVVQK
jgi:hypothetical protein